MIKSKFRITIPLCGLLLLSSCRTEELLHEVEQKEELSKKFITFTKKYENDVIDYGAGFKSLALRYDSIHKTNMTGRADIAKLEEELQTNNKMSFSTSNEVVYIDFNVRSQLMEEENGDKWMVFPKVKGGKVENLVVALLSEEETKLGYYLLGKDSEIYRKYLLSFEQQVLKTEYNDLQYHTTSHYTEIPEVVIIKLVPIDPRITLPISISPYEIGGGGIGDIGSIVNRRCYEFYSCIDKGYQDYYGGSYPPPPDPPKNPCDKVKEGKSNADKIISNNVVKEKMDKVLRNKLGSTNEWAVSIGQNADGSYSVSKELEGQPTSGNVPDVPSGNYVGDGHIHDGSGVPSPGDFYGMLKVMKNNTHYQVRFVYGRLYGNEEVYALIITDRNLAMQFLANYPMERHYDYDKHTFKRGSSIFEDYEKIKDISYKGFYNMTDVYGRDALPMAYVLDKYNTGIALVKQNKNGKFESFKVAETPYVDKLAAGKVKDGATITNPCP